MGIFDWLFGKKETPEAQRARLAESKARQIAELKRKAREEREAREAAEKKKDESSIETQLSRLVRSCNTIPQLIALVNSSFPAKLETVQIRYALRDRVYDILNQITIDPKRSPGADKLAYNFIKYSTKKDFLLQLNGLLDRFPELRD